jgi:N-acetylglutamate synthase-like GNAT family acetyltransferase
MRENMGMYHELHEIPWHQDRIEAHFREKENHSVFSCRQWIGFISLEWKNDSVFIHSLQLIQKVQGSVYGVQILNWLLDQARERDIDSIECKTFASSPVRELYKKIGFEIQEQDELFLELRMDLTRAQLPTTWNRFGNRSTPQYPGSAPDN